MNQPTVQIWNEDCVSGIRQRLAPASVRLTVCSPPFEELFSYSGKIEDVGNNGSTIDVRAGRFALNMRFVADALLWVHQPGTNACIHIQQLLAYQNMHGFQGRRDFRGALIDVFGAAGWRFTGEVAIPKDPQAIAQRLCLHSLQFKTGHSRSSTNWAMAPNDYVLIFQRPGEAEPPVRPLVYHAQHKPLPRGRFFAERGGPDDRAYVAYLRQWASEQQAVNPGGWLSTDDWVGWASGTWEDVNEFDILDGARSRGHKEEQHEKHVCPLNLEVIRRCVLLYSNPGDLVLDPFMGIGSTAYVALGGPSPMTKCCVDAPRAVVGFELKESYHRAAVANAARAARQEQRTDHVTLYDLAEVG